MKTLCALMLLAATAKAGPALDPARFEKLSQGQTLHFSADGQHFGSEQYFSDRNVLWKPAFGDCEYGFWYPQGAEICFAYEARPEPVCWLFHQRGGQYFARQSDDPDGWSEIALTGSDNDPLDCPGPKIGS